MWINKECVQEERAEVDSLESRQTQFAQESESSKEGSRQLRGRPRKWTSLFASSKEWTDQKNQTDWAAGSRTRKRMEIVTSDLKKGRTGEKEEQEREAQERVRRRRRGGESEAIRGGDMANLLAERWCFPAAAVSSQPGWTASLSPCRPPWGSGRLLSQG